MANGSEPKPCSQQLQNGGLVHVSGARLRLRRVRAAGGASLRVVDISPSRLHVVSVGGARCIAALSLAACSCSRQSAVIMVCSGVKNHQAAAAKVPLPGSSAVAGVRG